MNCVMCKGKVEDTYISHVVDFNGYIIIIKNVPAKVCSQCGESFLDHATAVKIEKIIDVYKAHSAEVLILNYADKVA